MLLAFTHRFGDEREESDDAKAEAMFTSWWAVGDPHGLHGGSVMGGEAVGQEACHGLQLCVASLQHLMLGGYAVQRWLVRLLTRASLRTAAMPG